MKIKKIVAAFMAAAIACGSVAVTAGAEEIRSFTAESYGGASVKSDKLTEDGCIYDGCEYTLDNDEYFFMGEPYKDNGVYSERKELVIPSRIDDIPVTEIGHGRSGDAFWHLYGLEKLYIPSSIEKINLVDSMYGEFVSFSRCRKLTDIYFEGTEEQWYDIQAYSIDARLVTTDIKWDGKFSEDSNLWNPTNVQFIDYYPTLHVNCKSIDDEGTIVNFSAKAEKPAKVSGIKRSGSKTYIKLSWNESKNAKSYVIKYSTDKKTWKTKTVKANSVKLTKLKAGTKYYIKIAAKNSAGTSAYSKVFSVTTKK